MLNDIINGGISPLELLLWAIAAICTLSVHELCHGLAAYKLGDPTAKQMGRLTLNPIRHIDPMGFIMVIVAGFGWAKPVPVDMRYFKNQKRGMALCAAAGPTSNFVLAFLCMIIYSSVFLMTKGQYPDWLDTFMQNIIILNIYLGIFNLLPVPPLDGSKILGAFLPDRAYYKLMRYERYGMIAVVALIMVLRQFDRNPIDYLIWQVVGGMNEAAYFLTKWLQ